MICWFSFLKKIGRKVNFVKLFLGRDNLVRFHKNLWSLRVQKRWHEKKEGMYLVSEGWISGFIFKKNLSCCIKSCFPFFWTVTKGNPFCRVQVFIILFTSSVWLVTYKMYIHKTFSLKIKIGLKNLILSVCFPLFLPSIKTTFNVNIKKKHECWIYTSNLGKWATAKRNVTWNRAKW